MLLFPNVASAVRPGHQSGDQSAGQCGRPAGVAGQSRAVPVIVSQCAGVGERDQVVATGSRTGVLLARGIASRYSRSPAAVSANPAHTVESVPQPALIVIEPPI